jgi:hypothetical protein
MANARQEGSAPISLNVLGLWCVAEQIVRFGGHPKHAIVAVVEIYDCVSVPNCVTCITSPGCHT